jgi:hypothetical protein
MDKQRGDPAGAQSAGNPSDGLHIGKICLSKWENRVGMGENEGRIIVVTREGVEQFVLQEIKRQGIVDKAIEGKGGMEPVGAEVDVDQPIDISVPNVLVTVLGLCKAKNGWLQKMRVERRDHRASIRQEAPLTRVSERDVRSNPLSPRDNSKSQNVIVDVELERVESEGLQFSLAVVLDERAGDGLVRNAPPTIPPLLESIRSGLSQVVHMSAYISLDFRRRNGGRLRKPLDEGAHAEGSRRGASMVGGRPQVGSVREGGVIERDAPGEISQRLAGVEPPAGDLPVDPLVFAQGIRRAAGSVEGEEKLEGEPLTGGVSLDELPKLANHLAVVSASQLRLDEILPDCYPHLIEPGGLAGRRI